ncbi:hypothetical protein NJ7G_0076 [Natrinema sp. J7-2]|nr:hypothetical protein NJ7G_0076 [Natrinema sp. J7-2]
MNHISHPGIGTRLPRPVDPCANTPVPVLFVSVYSHTDTSIAYTCRALERTATAVLLNQRQFTVQTAAERRQATLFGF